MPEVAENDSPLLKLWNLLNLLEDYIGTGFRRSRPANIPKSVLSYCVSGCGDVRLNDIEREIYACQKCGLGSKRRRAVPGKGPLAPLLLVVGEAPGEEEDRSGLPFVGKAGRYLDRWLAAVKFGPQEVTLDRENNTFIANIIKCHPPHNRDPEPGELEVCLPYLERQIAVLNPKAILTLGRFAARALTGLSSGIGALRSKIYKYHATPLIPTYHPSAVLRNPSLRRSVWEDLKLLKSVLDDEISSR